MSKFPSGTALLGLLALSGFKDRDRISDLLERANNDPKMHPTDGPAVPMVESAFLNDLNSRFGQADLKSTLTGAFTDLDQIFASNGYANRFHSWIADPAGATITREELLDALGEELIVGLSQKTGLTRDEVLFQLADALPMAVNFLSGPVQEAAAKS